MCESQAGGGDYPVQTTSERHPESVGTVNSTLPGRILVVEDEPLVAEDIALKLQQEGYTVVGRCASGSEALTLTEQLRPDLVLMDIMLPGDPDGIETCSHLRRRFGIPVIYLTAYVDEDLLKRARITEPFAYILKPCSARDLHVAIAMATYKSTSEARIKKLAWHSDSLMSICDAALVTDVAGSVSFLNAAAQDLLKITAQDAAGLPIDQAMKLTTAAGENIGLEVVRHAVQQHASYVPRVPTSLVFSDGNVLPVEVVASPVKDIDGEVRGAVLLIHDISSRLRANAALLDSEQRYRTLIESMSDGLACLDAGNRVVYVNDCLCTLLGYDAEELLGHELAEFLDESNDCMFRDRPDGGGLGSTGAQDVEFVTKTERRLPVHISVRPLRDVNGVSTGAIAVVTDMTSRMEAEQQRLVQAQQQRDVLIREVHHRIKNNLQGVVSLLRQHITENPGLRNVVERVIAQIRSMAVVYGLQSGQYADDLRLCDMLTAICGMAGDVMNPRHLPVVDIKLPAPVRVSSIEAVPIALILNELIFNAIKHVAASGTVAGVTVSLRLSGNTARVLILNRGVHLPETFDFATNRGMGTGLLLVKSLLPHDGACLAISDDVGGVSAELLLRPPVILSPDATG